MTPHCTTLLSPPVFVQDQRLDTKGVEYQHSVLEPRTLPLESAQKLLPGLAEAVHKVLDPKGGVRFPGAVRTTWLDTAELSALYPELHLASVGALYHVADPLWLPAHHLVREFEGEMFIKELDGECVPSHFRTIQASPDATPTLLLASPLEMLTVYSHLNTPQNEDALIPLIALAGGTLTVGGFFIDRNRFHVDRGVPSGVQVHKRPVQLVRGRHGRLCLMHEFSTSPWSRAYWPVYREGKLTWTTMTCFV